MDEQCKGKQAIEASYRARAYADRADAGRALADLAEDRWWEDVLVLAVGRGGVVVGVEIARRLGAQLALIAARRVRAPNRPEFTLGAVCSDGTKVFNPALIHAAGISQEVLSRASERAVLKARERQARWPSDSVPDATGRTVLLVDDGIDTGATLRACISSLSRKELRMLAVAVPVGARESCEQVAPLVDAFLCPVQPEQLVSLAHQYRSFPQVSDRQVQQVLLGHRAWLAAQPAYFQTEKARPLSTD